MSDVTSGGTGIDSIKRIWLGLSLLVVLMGTGAFVVGLCVRASHGDGFGPRPRAGVIATPQQLSGYVPPVAELAR